jgi:hypothetical protein
MSDIEKLRALLAEARVVTQDSLESNTTGFEAEDEVCKCNACERYRSIIARIDAALAEPVVECHKERDTAWFAGYEEGKALAENMKAEADARCETLRDLADKAAWAQGDAQRRMIEAQKQRDEARAEVERLQGAYQRGAEAMREAAMGAAWHSAAMGLHKRIKEMPLPEDKP